MSEPFLGEIRIVSFNFAPSGWAQCNGQLVPINMNMALFSLLGTTYGGNGQTNFALPDFRGRAPVHWGSWFTMGQRSGEEAHTLTNAEMPQHTHLVSASSAAPNAGLPDGNLFAANANAYAKSYNVAMHPSSVTNTGGNQPHYNLQPYMVLNFIIALQGVFPSQN